MAVKEWFRRMQPVQLYLILFFTIAFFAVEIVASYVTHALTLLMNAYHMLCNIVALVGCIASVKYENESNRSQASSMCSLKSSSDSLNDQLSSSANASSSKKSKQLRSEKRMMNTFGWARIDIVTMLVCCVLQASFCFSLIVEALQTLVHIDHLDAMHHPLPVMTIGASGILLNAFCYFLIGGYTFNQGVFLHFTKEGNVILKKSGSSNADLQPQSQHQQQQQQSNQVVTTSSGDKKAESAISRLGGSNNNNNNNGSPVITAKTQGFREMCRDVLGCVLVVVTSCTVYFTDAQFAKFVDPIVAIVSAVSLFVLSYPYVKESGMILLQTIPNHINIDLLQKELLAAFPDIINVHDLHVWQLNGEKVVSTVHIIYADPTVCARITDHITAFFIEQGITHVTIQPEFCHVNPHVGAHTDCLIKCQSKHCSASTCCSRDAILDQDENHGHRHHHHHHSHEVINRKFGSKEIVPAASACVDLKRFSVKIDEINETATTATTATTVTAATTAATKTTCTDTDEDPALRKSATGSDSATELAKSDEPSEAATVRDSAVIVAGKDDESVAKADS